VRAKLDTQNRGSLTMFWLSTTGTCSEPLEMGKIYDIHLPPSKAEFYEIDQQIVHLQPRHKSGGVLRLDSCGTRRLFSSILERRLLAQYYLGRGEKFMYEVKIPPPMFFGIFLSVSPPLV